MQGPICTPKTKLKVIKDLALPSTLLGFEMTSLRPGLKSMSTNTTSSTANTNVITNIATNT